MSKATCITVALAIVSVSAAGQTPTPPTPPSPPAVGEPAPVPTPAPRAKPVKPWRVEFPDIDLAAVKGKLDAMKMDMELAPMPMDVEMPDMGLEMPDIDIEMPNVDIEMAHLKSTFDLDRSMRDMKWSIDEAMPDLDFAMPVMPAMPALPMIDVPMTPMIDLPMTPMIDDAMIVAPVALSKAARAFTDMAKVKGESPFLRQFSSIATNPPDAWAQADPADSLYRLAREALNRGEYRRAAQLFGDISQRFPNSAYSADARYWRAFSLYRIGGTSDLRDALAALQDNSHVYRQASLQTDAAALAARIRGALAAQGDAQAKEQLGRVAADHSDTCDREDLAVRIEALNSLGQTDPQSTTPILRRLLARKDDCSASLRRAALWLLGRRTDAEAMSLVMNSARNDPDIRVRADALRFLAAMPGDQPVATLEEIARTPGNEQLQRAAIMALGRSDSPRARQSIQAIVARTDLSEELRASALASMDAEHTSDNGAYIRSLYPRLETPRLKAEAIRAIANIGGNDNEQWLLSLVRNPNESADVRATALRYAGRSSIPIADLTRMYDVADARSLREQLIRLYAQRTEPEATDKLFAIARSGTDPDLRRLAISALSRKNDPRTKQLLLEIIDK